MSDTDDRDDDGMANMPDFGDHVDSVIFSQILEMDDDEAVREFSEPLVTNFFEQATETFGKMDKALTDKELDTLSSLGHFLKGSSATLGFNKIRDSCQVIQQYGHNLNVDGTPETNEEVCLEKISHALEKVKLDTEELEQMMKDFFSPPSEQ
ncbi:signal transduction histidine kinase [Apodospora peruviana]|uniref:Signal transduction histidine kinase n=1 Tax=Apodospora peruviana TaxID=516989 RepID=A0AAE0HYQ8_9PEZI|nr:signal transduction histidine kinase [Apodospora peruviana]